MGVVAFVVAALTTLLVAVGSASALAAAPIIINPLRNTPLGQGAVGIGAYVNPGGSELTDCHIAYGLTTSYGQSAPCISMPPANEEEDLVTAHLSGLAPGATYHYKLVVNGPAGGAESEDGFFRTLAAPSSERCPNAGALGAAQLPDCRAWEMVSPPNKNGGEAIGQVGRTRAAADGSALEFDSLADFNEPKGGTVSTEYIAQRSSTPNPGDNGWTSHAITAPQQSFPLSAAYKLDLEPRYLGSFSEDFSHGVFFSYGAIGNEPNVANELNFYVRSDLGTPGRGSYQLVSPCLVCQEPGGTPLPPLGNNASQRALPQLVGMSPDGEHIAFSSLFRLTADTPAQSSQCGYSEFLFPAPSLAFCRWHMYEWDHGTLRLAGILPDKTAADSSTLGHPLELPVNPNAVSNGKDGHTRIVFVQPTDSQGHSVGEVGFPSELFMDISGREGKLFGREDGMTTVQLNASERTESTPYAPARFEAASADGERIFFRTEQALTNETAAGGIYMYDTTKPEHHRLTLISGGREAEGIVGTSEDGHYVYMLIGRDIYLWHDGTLAKIANLPFASEVTSNNRLGGYDTRSARVSPDGKHLLFADNNGSGLLSIYGGTDYDHGRCPNGFGCLELYVYGAETNTLQCASCEPTGAPPVRKDYETSILSTADAGGALLSEYQIHALSDDGRYVFFNSIEALVSSDTNGRMDPYVFDTVTGEVHLLSSGEGSTDSFFADATPDGKNAFILTKQPLSGWDVDGAYDVYDARVNGGLPEPPQLPASCQGDACQPAPVQLNDATPASSSFSGAGNPGPVSTVHKQKRSEHKPKRRKRRARAHQKRTVKPKRRSGR
jgi:hypothetical protein